MACNTYMYILYLLYAGIGLWSLNKLSKMEKSLMNSSYQQLPGVGPINFREKKIFKYVHVQIALPKKNFKCVVFLMKYCLLELP